MKKLLFLLSLLIAAPSMAHAQPLDPSLNRYLPKNRGRATGPIRLRNYVAGAEPAVNGGGWVIYDSTNTAVSFWNGAAWTDLLAVGGAVAFDAITTGTNLIATMTCGTGCAIGPAGTGTVAATTLTSTELNTIALAVDAVGLTIEASGAQTAHLQDWDLNGGTTAAYVLNQGSAHFPQVNAGDTNEFGATIAGATIPSYLSVGDDTTTPQLDLMIQRHTGAVAATSPLIEMLKSRGTAALPTVVVTGDQLGQIDAGGYDGTDFASSSAILFESEGVIAADQIPGLIRTFTADAAGTLTERIRTDSAGLTTFGLDGIANALTVGVSLANNTASTGGATVQRSSLLEFIGHAWDTAPGADWVTKWAMGVLPASAATPTSALHWYTVNEITPGVSAYTTSLMSLSSTGLGNLTTGGGFTATNGNFTASGNGNGLVITGDAMIRYGNLQTNPAMMLAGPNASRTIILCEAADYTTDFGYGIPTNPTLVIQSADATTPAQRITFAHDQTNGVITAETGGLAVNDDGGKGVATVIQTKTESVTFAGGGGDASQVTTGSVIPAGAFVVGVSTRVTTADSGAAVSMDIGIAAVDTDAFAVGTSLAEGDTTTSANGSGDWSGVLLIQPNFSAQEITVTPNVAAIDMVVAISVHYIDVIAATSN